MLTWTDEYMLCSVFHPFTSRAIRNAKRNENKSHSPRITDNISYVKSSSLPQGGTQGGTPLGF
jgi:hypothetical protein